MSLVESLLYPDMKDIIFQKDPPNSTGVWKIFIHTEKEVLEPLSIISIDRKRDYVNAYCDTIGVRVMLPMGVYVKKLKPYMNNIQITLHRDEVEQNSGYANVGSVKRYERYRAVYVPEETSAFNDRDFEKAEEVMLDQTDMVPVAFQLIDRYVEPFIYMKTDAAYQDVDREDLIRSVISHGSTTISVDGKNPLDNIDIVPFNNLNKHKQLVIPSFTTLVNLPRIIQNRHGGLYNSGVGSYITRYKTKLTWFIYPLFNTERFTSAKRKLIIYVAPASPISETVITRRVDDDIVYIIARINQNPLNQKETDGVNNTEGVRMMDANAFVNKPVELTDRGAVGNRSRLNYEIKGVQRSDGNNAVSMSPNVASTNIHSDLSKVAQNIGERMDVQWDASDDRLIYPGMPVRVYHEKKDQIVRKDGVVSLVHTLTARGEDGLTSKNLISSSHITLFLETLYEI